MDAGTRTGRLSFLSHAILQSLSFFLLGGQFWVHPCIFSTNRDETASWLTRLGFSRWTKKDNLVKNNFCLVLIPQEQGKKNKQ